MLNIEVKRCFPYLREQCEERTHLICEWEGHYATNTRAVYHFYVGHIGLKVSGKAAMRVTYVNRRIFTLHRCGI